MGSGTISRELTSERTQDLGKVTLEADERLNKLNFQWQSLRFGMAKEIAEQTFDALYQSLTNMTTK